MVVCAAASLHVGRTCRHARDIRGTTQAITAATRPSSRRGVGAVRDAVALPEAQLPARCTRAALRVHSAVVRTRDAVRGGGAPDTRSCVLLAC